MITVAIINEFGTWVVIKQDGIPIATWRLFGTGTDV
jgi:hypothetical protein